MILIFNKVIVNFSVNIDVIGSILEKQILFLSIIFFIKIITLYIL